MSKGRYHVKYNQKTINKYCLSIKIKKIIIRHIAAILWPLAIRCAYCTTLEYCNRTIHQNGNIILKNSEINHWIRSDKIRKDHTLYK